VLLLTISPGQEVLTEVEAQLRERGITDAAVASLIGAVDACAISNMDAADPGKDIITEYEQPFELSGTGEITKGRAHLHVVLGKQGDCALAGHLHWARVENFFVHAYVIVLEGTEIVRNAVPAANPQRTFI
jgi:predicted DNA-binding protein with PD1-like motif